MDAGSPDNKTVWYSDIQSVTCTPAEWDKLYKSLIEPYRAGCENAGGCSFTFNGNFTLEAAQASLQRWLKPYTGNPRFVIVLHNVKP